MVCALALVAFLQVLCLVVLASLAFSAAGEMDEEEPTVRATRRFFLSLTLLSDEDPTVNRGLFVCFATFAAADSGAKAPTPISFEPVESSDTARHFQPAPFFCAAYLNCTKCSICGSMPDPVAR